MKAFTNLLHAGQALLGLGDSNLSSTAPAIRGDFKSCPIDPALSCSNTNNILNADIDSCCLNYPGGLFAATQFWNTNPHRGPAGYLGPTKNFTIHGLWPDNCNGTYESVCDCNRSGDCSSWNKKCTHTCNKNYSNIGDVLKKYGQDELIDYMSKHWKGNRGDEELHQHEWSKHGTCINSIEPKCYDNYQPAQEVVDYFRVAVAVQQQLTTYHWLEAAGIVPDIHKTFTKAAINAALQVPRGVSAVIGCEGNELREIWYFFKVRGSISSGEFVPSEPDFSGVNGKPGIHCPDNIRYLPKPEQRELEL